MYYKHFSQVFISVLDAVQGNLEKVIYNRNSTRVKGLCDKYGLESEGNSCSKGKLTQSEEIEKTEKCLRSRSITENYFG